ncbi:MAG: hypothetical protein ACRC8Y_10060 [Chroococcales cyanobacterium]
MRKVTAGDECEHLARYSSSEQDARTPGSYPHPMTPGNAIYNNI